MYNMTLTQDSQKLNLVLSPDRYDNLFLVAVTTEVPPAHADFRRRGQARVQLLICIEDGQLIREAMDTTCDDPGKPTGERFWGFEFDGVNITIRGRNVENPTRDVPVHVGNIVMASESQFQPQRVQTSPKVFRPRSRGRRQADPRKLFFSPPRISPNTPSPHVQVKEDCAFVLECDNLSDIKYRFSRGCLHSPSDAKPYMCTQ